jgi:hypothetical protein
VQGFAACNTRIVVQRRSDAFEIIISFRYVSSRTSVVVRSLRGFGRAKSQGLCARSGAEVELAAAYIAFFPSDSSIRLIELRVSSQVSRHGKHNEARIINGPLPDDGVQTTGTYNNNRRRAL